MIWPHGLDLLLMLAFLVAVFATFVWFAIQLLRGSKRERSAIAQALEKARELLEMGKISTQEFETIKRGLETS